MDGLTYSVNSNIVDKVNLTFLVSFYTPRAMRISAPGRECLWHWSCYIHKRSAYISGTQAGLTSELLNYVGLN